MSILIQVWNNHGFALNPTFHLQESPHAYIFIPPSETWGKKFSKSTVPTVTTAKIQKKKKSHFLQEHAENFDSYFLPPDHSIQKVGLLLPLTLELDQDVHSTPVIQCICFLKSGKELQLFLVFGVFRLYFGLL